MATTWAATAYGVKATCTTGTESAPSAGTEGLAVESVNKGPGALTRLLVHVEATLALTAGQKLLCYSWNPIGGSGSGQWNRFTALDLAVTAVVGETFQVTLLVPVGRIAFLPSGVGQACTVFIDGLR